MILQLPLFRVSVVDTLCGTKRTDLPVHEHWMGRPALFYRVSLWSCISLQVLHVEIACFSHLSAFSLLYQVRLEECIITGVIFFSGKYCLTECHGASFSQCIHSLWAVDPEEVSTFPIMIFGSLWFFSSSLDSHYSFNSLPDLHLLQQQQVDFSSIFIYRQHNALKSYTQMHGDFIFGC